MRAGLKLSHKALILVAIPLAFEVVFFSMLSNMLHEAEVEVEKEAHARAIVKHLNNLHLCIMGSVGGMVAYMLSGNPTNFRHAMAAGGPVTTELSALEALCSEQTQESAAVRQIRNMVQRTEEHVREIRAMADEKGGMPDIQQMNSLKAHVAELRRETDRIIVVENEIEEASPKLQAEQRLKVRRFLIAGMVLNFLLAISLAIYFNRGTTKRLNILMDNTYRLACGKELNPPIGGRDEIAHLDLIFQQMAADLAEASRKDKESEANLRRILESMPVGLLVLTEEGIVELANPTIGQMFQSDVSTLPGKSLATLLSNTAETEIRRIMEMLCERAPNKVEEMEGLRKESQTFPIEVSMTRFQTGKGTRVLAIILDVTERFEVEKMKRELVSIVSHELKTPLTSIQGFLTLLAENVYGELTEQGMRRVTLADRNVEHLIKLVNDLLAVEKLESGRVELNLAPVNFSNVMERCLEGVNQLAARQNVKVESQNEDIQIYADEDRLTQVLINLVSNAVKYSPAHSSVQITAQKSTDWLEVRVTDQGCGIPLAAQKRIFERFQQVNSAEDERKGGTGLGLAICKAIIEQHGGLLGVESEEGKGSSFWFRIPASVNGATLKLSATVKEPDPAQSSSTKEPDQSLPAKESIKEPAQSASTTPGSQEKPA